MRRLPVVILLGVLGCVLGSSHPEVAASQLTTTLQQRGCGGTRVRSDSPLPAWTMSAHPPSGILYVVSKQGNAVGVLFGSPLRSGHPTQHANKILWIVREPRDGQPLHLTARPLHTTSPTRRVAYPRRFVSGRDLSLYPRCPDSRLLASDARMGAQPSDARSPISVDCAQESLHPMSPSLASNKAAQRVRTRPSALDPMKERRPPLL